MFRKFKIWEQLPQIVIGIIFIALIWGFGYLVSHHQNAVEKRYGFCTMTPDMKWAPCHIEPIMIRDITPGGAFDKAGFQDKDIVVSPCFNSVTDFLHSLKKQNGTTIVFQIIPYEDFKPVCDPSKRGKPVKRIVIVP